MQAYRITVTQSIKNGQSDYDGPEWLESTYVEYVETIVQVAEVVRGVGPEDNYRRIHSINIESIWIRTIKEAK